MSFIQKLLTVICGLVTLCSSQVPVPSSSSMVIKSVSPAFTLSPTPSLPPDLDALTIPSLRARDYPGSEFEEGAPVGVFASYTSEIVSYRSDGLKIQALLTRPTTPRPPGGYPAVVFVHGYIPPRDYTTTGKYVAYVDYLARQGIVVLKIDLRGHGVSEGQPSGAYYSADYVIDTLNAYESLRTLDIVDPAKVSLWGHSMAGNVILRAAAVRPDVPRVVIWAGAVYTYTDMREYGIQDGSYQPSQNPNRSRGQSIREQAGEVSSESLFWRTFVPTNYLHELTTVIQIHHANDDSVVSVAYSRNLAKLLDDAAIRYELYEYPTGGHNIDSPSFDLAMQRTVELIRE